MMKKFMISLRAKMRQFMSGRYGYDEVSHLLSALILILLLLGFAPKLAFLRQLGLLLWLMLIFRSLSRNLEKRQAERAAYLRLKKKITGWYYIRRQAWLLRKTHCFYRCKQCKTYVRVPKGKGKIQIKCPKCGAQFIKKT